MGCAQLHVKPIYEVDSASKPPGIQESELGVPLTGS